MKNQKNNKLPLSILNYFAAFTETKFNFRTLINYRWTNDELAFDLGLFQNFQNMLLEKIKRGDHGPTPIKPGEYTLSLKKNQILSDIEKALSEDFGPDYLKLCIQKELDNIIERDKAIIASEAGTPTTDNDEQVREIKQTEKAFREGTRKYNLALRKKLGQILTEHQDKKIERLKAQYGISSLPQSIFNSTNFLRKHFDALQLLAKEGHSEEAYFYHVQEHFKKNLEDILLYDLFVNIQKYARFNNTGTQYLFFHELNRKSENGCEAYPIFFIEINFALGNQQVTLSFPRNLVFINAPAVNYFRFPSVLTTPRSSTFQNLAEDIGGLEVFLQAQYGISEPFVMEPYFKRISGPKENFPDINCRIGFQVIRKENKRLLDYSEIMTHLLTGGSSKFSDFIANYINGNVENIQDQVDREYKAQYPVKSSKRYISDNPLNLNNAQQRILLSLNNPKNNIVVVDGPPGTGKSHTIAALVYWANQEDKSVVITSHKKEALDVIDRMLTEKFKMLHPKAKPAIVRFGKNGKTLNTLDNTLQNAVINAAGNRAHNYNEQATAKDLETTTAQVKKKLESQLSSAETYAQTINDLFDFEQIQQQLMASSAFTPADIALPKVRPGVQINFDALTNFAAHENLDSLNHMTITELNFLLKNKSDIPRFLNACEAINLHGENYPADIQTTAIPRTFEDLVKTRLSYFKPSIPLQTLTPRDLSSGLVKKLLKKVPPEAVSAVNVSSKYSASYFREIIHAYSHDYNISASEQETASLIDDVSRETVLKAASASLPPLKNNRPEWSRPWVKK